ncbi:hypothetical protein RCL1_007002 [Eukaryota sp. TZLM3-RCL]
MSSKQDDVDDPSSVLFRHNSLTDLYSSETSLPLGSRLYSLLKVTQEELDSPPGSKPAVKRKSISKPLYSEATSTFVKVNVEKLAKQERARPRLSQIRDRYRDSSVVPPLSPPGVSCDSARLTHRQGTHRSLEPTSSPPSVTNRSNSRAHRGSLFKLYKEVDRVEKDNLKLREEIEALTAEYERRQSSYSKRLESLSTQLNSLQSRLEEIKSGQKSVLTENERMDRHRQLLNQIKEKAECIESVMNLTLSDEQNIIEKSYNYRLSAQENELLEARNIKPVDELERYRSVLNTARSETNFLHDQIEVLMASNEGLEEENRQIMKEIQEIKINQSNLMDEMVGVKKDFDYYTGLIDQVSSCYLPHSLPSNSPHVPPLPLQPLSSRNSPRQRPSQVSSPHTYESLSSRVKDSEIGDNSTVTTGQSARLFKKLNKLQLDTLASVVTESLSPRKVVKTPRKSKYNEVDKSSTEKLVERLSSMLQSKQKRLKMIRHQHKSAVNTMSQLEIILRKTLGQVRQSRSVNIGNLTAEERNQILEMAFSTEEVMKLLKQL